MFNLIIMSFICTHLWKEYASRSNLFIISATNEMLKTLFTKSKLISCYFIDIYTVYRNRTFILMKFVLFNFSVINVYNVLSIFM